MIQILRTGCVWGVAMAILTTPAAGQVTTPPTTSPTSQPTSQPTTRPTTQPTTQPQLKPASRAELFRAYADAIKRGDAAELRRFYLTDRPITLKYRDYAVSLHSSGARIRAALLNHGTGDEVEEVFEKLGVGFLHPDSMAERYEEMAMAGDEEQGADAVEMAAAEVDGTWFIDLRMQDPPEADVAEAKEQTLASLRAGIQTTVAIVMLSEKYVEVAESPEIGSVDDFLQRSPAMFGPSDENSAAFEVRVLDESIVFLQLLRDEMRRLGWTDVASEVDNEIERSMATRKELLAELERNERD